MGDRIKHMQYPQSICEIIDIDSVWDWYRVKFDSDAHPSTIDVRVAEKLYKLIPQCPVVHANTHYNNQPVYAPGTFGHMRASAIIKADMAMQQGNLIKPKGPKFKAGDKIRSLHYPEVIREVLLVLPNQYIINPHIQGQDKQGYVDAEHLEFLYEKCGIPEEIPLVPDYCNHDWHEYIGI
ncbi:MAG TPA: hypothetical protein VNZ45_03935, partial [Bacteroidia bacterium]|nr:hypothetical protein [Bacteroidia bacterium]